MVLLVKIQAKGDVIRKYGGNSLSKLQIQVATYIFQLLGSPAG
jgi:hypothetical protein